MTLATTTSREQYATNGQTLVWPVPFAFHGADDLAVVISDPDGGNPELLPPGTGYLVAGGDGGAGALTCPAFGPPLAAGRLLTVTRDIALLQDLDLVNLDGFDAELVERQFDRSRMIDQQLQEQIDRCVKAPVTSPDALTFEDIRAQAGAAAASASAASTSAGQAAAARAGAEAAAVLASGYADAVNPELLAPADHDHDAAYEAIDPAIMRDDQPLSAPADLSATGIIRSDVLATTVTKFQLLYRASSGKLAPADADAAATMPGLYLALAAGDAEDVIPVLAQGRARDDAWTWTPGGLLYAGTTPGSLIQVPPDGAGDQVQVVGVAVDAYIIDFMPCQVLVEVA